MKNHLLYLWKKGMGIDFIKEVITGSEEQIVKIANKETN